MKEKTECPPVDIRIYKNGRRCFPIIDHREVYLIGASLKDLGRKMFALLRLNLPVKTIITTLSDKRCSLNQAPVKKD